MSTENKVEVAVEGSPAKIEVTPPVENGVGEEILKSGDKLEIEDEERVKMLNEENKPNKTGGGGGEGEKKKKALEEAAAQQKEDVKRRIPIGAIRIPGFLRSRSRDKNREGDDNEEGSDLLEPPCTAVTVGPEAPVNNTSKLAILSKLKFSNPFSKNSKSTEEDKTDLQPNSPDEVKPTEGEGRAKGLINAIKLPLVNVIPKKLKSTKDRDIEDGTGTPGVQAGLASMETLDDSNGSHTTKADDDKGGDADMETVKLDIGTDNNTGYESEKPAMSDEDEEHSKWDIPECCRRSVIVQRITEHQTLGVIALVFLFMIVFILIPLLVFGGYRPPTNAPIYNGKYVKAVTSCGNVEGMLEEGVFAFRGIPYALPPVDELRWKPPKQFDLKTCWNDTLPAHNSSAFCWQRYNNETVNGAENCLTLDIFTPYVRYHSPLPVVVLVGSDTLMGGSPGEVQASPRIARSKELVLVRPNFRLGPLGFLAARPLTSSVHPPTSGNYGLLDLIEALKWVQLNIEHFGGDKKMVTILAHRGGATLVTAITSMRKPEKLFARAWLSSGSAIFPSEPLVNSENRNRQYLDKLKCDHYGAIECLLDQDMEELTDQVPLEWLYKAPELPTPEENVTASHQWLVMDGNILKEHPSEVWKRGPLKVQLVFGTTAHAEATKELKNKKQEWNVEDVAQVVRSSLLSSQGLSEEALRRYNTTYQGLAAMISDIRTVCPLLTVARQIPGSGFYVVTQTHDDNMVEANADIRAILGTYASRTPEERRYVTSIQQMFYRYVAHGTFDSLPSDASLNKLIMLGQDPLPANEYPNCDYWISKDIVPKYGRID
ncbi:hypothetical protein LSTR_LSTR006144 [Laodelphax striatellus]|uniref:Carboxylesterase type B domain-containing protein n=1 Tax=Laodelphax striatellus TaxID=195883 RepID=A0A482WYA2_LAOST|nr:hypothetical protein LSTR_LSTR006144 [Laodelphax striatellus]